MSKEKNVLPKPPLIQVITKRNNRLKRLFRELDIPVRIIGNENNPTIIYNNTIAVSAFVNNFNLNFTDKPKYGNIIKTVKLTHDINIDANEILEIIHMHQQQAIYNIKLKNEELFLAGYNYIDSIKCAGRYPVFAKHNYKIYFKLKNLNEALKELKPEYDVISHKPFLNTSLIVAEDEQY